MENSNGLKRQIGLWGLISNNINITIGAGIFLLPVIVAERLGTGSIIAYLICGVLIMFITLCFAEIGTIVTRTGGAYSYIEEAFGKYAGFLTTNIFIFGGAVMANAAVANGLADTIAYFVPLFSKEIVRITFFLLTFGTFAWLNVRGVSRAMRMVNFNTIAKLTPLLLVAIFGWFYISPENIRWEGAPAFNDIGEMSLMLIFAFVGAETALNVSGEIKNPTRTIPRGILISVLLIVMLYILIQYSVQGILGSDMLLFRDAPLAEAARRMIGPLGATIVVIGTSFAMFGNLSGMVLNMPRLMFAAARDKVIAPAALGNIHPRFSTPHVSVIVYAMLGFIFSSIGEFKQLALLSGSSFLLIYFGVVAAVIKYRLKGRRETGSFRIPGGIAVPVISLAGIIWFLTNLPREELVAMAIFLALLTTIYFVFKAFSRKKLG